MTGHPSSSSAPAAPPAAAGPVRLADVRSGPLDVVECLRAVEDPAAGGTAIFVGTVRQQDGGRGVSALEYEAHPGAAGVLAQLAEQVAAEHPAVVALAVVHRHGPLVVGDLAVVAAAACPHRGEAFDAARALVEAVKAGLPVWKRQEFEDGGEEWVGSA